MEVLIIWSKIFTENKSIVQSGTIRLTWSNDSYMLAKWWCNTVVSGWHYCCYAPVLHWFFMLWSIRSWFKTGNARTGRPGNGGLWRITLSVNSKNCTNVMHLNGRWWLSKCVRESIHLVQKIYDLRILPFLCHVKHPFVSQNLPFNWIFSKKKEKGKKKN